jgi:two-component system sensor histidine kinase SenX3
MSVRRMHRRSTEANESELASALLDSETQRTVFEQGLAKVPQGIILLGRDGDVRFMNPASIALVRPAATLTELTPHALQTLVRSAASDGMVAEQELEIGSPARIVVASATPLEGNSTLLMLHDVTDSRRIEAVRRDFVAAASHELKTPVAAIAALTEALSLAMERDPSAARRFVRQLGDAAAQLSELVRDLLDLSRLESSRQASEEFDVAAVIRAEIELRKSAEVALIQDAEQTVMVGSKSDLALAVRNLLDNAIRHTPAGGTVTARLRRHNGEAVIEVIDTGEGIASRNLARVFERFYRADSARSRSTGGTGLGLAIVRHVAESHGGSVEAESVLGEGSTFRIRLPLPT